LAVNSKAARNDWPATCSCPDEFGIQRGQGDQRTPAQVADAIKTLDLKEALSTVVHYLRLGGRDAGFAQRVQREVFGQQQIAPAFAHGTFLQLAELHDNVPRSIWRHGIGGELRLLAPG
jgi:hypothetical protein